MTGALSGIRVLELGGLGPAPFAAMMLADHGAEVIRVERIQQTRDEHISAREGLVDWDVTSRSRRSIGMDLKHPSGLELLLEFTENADVFIEGFRPGVAERLGCGPDVVHQRNPALVYGRMTGYGQTGPLANAVGHDINYLGLAGVLGHIGRHDQAPTPPLNLVGDYGGGAMFLVAGILMALIERQHSGRGQVVDAAMVDGAALLMAPLFGASQSGYWNDERGTNLLDSGAPFYDSYECSDGTWLCVGAIEPNFFANFCSVIGLDASWVSRQNDQTAWPELRALIAVAIGRRGREEWLERFDGVDACVAPVLTMAQAAHHRHAAERGAFEAIGASLQPAPAPRLSRTPGRISLRPQPAAANTAEVLASLGISAPRIAELAEQGVIG